MQNFLDFLLRGKYNWLIPDTKNIQKQRWFPYESKTDLKKCTLPAGLEAKNNFFVYYADYDPVLCLNADHT